MDYIDSSKDSEKLFRRIQGLVGDQSFSVILPKQYAINLGIKKGDYVKVHQQENRIIIEKA